MNFIVDKKKDEVSYVHIYVHPTKTIVRIDGNNNLYDHQHYNKIIVDLKRYFKPDKIKYIKEYLKVNLEAKGIKVFYIEDKPKDDNQQLSLF